MSDFPIESVRKDFPILQTKVYNQPLAYFDNGATTQKPISVIRKIEYLYSEANSSVHRSVNHLSEKMTERFEDARNIISGFIGAGTSKEVIFTAGTTASINLVASSFGEVFLEEHDEILISGMEHHSNIVPWQMICERKGANLKIIPVGEDGALALDMIDELLTEKTRLVALTQVSNVLGTINPVEKVISKAHLKNIPVLIDGAQAVQHGKIHVQKLDCDFYVFSGHKMYGPTGIGVLYAKEKWLEAMLPYQTGGEMIEKVSFTKTTFNELPFKFEAGTPNYVGAIGLAEAVNYIQSIGLDAIDVYESQVCEYASEKLRKIPGLKLFGDLPDKHPIFSFLLDGIHPYDTGMVLDKKGIAVRTGTHCAMPLMEIFGIEGTIRVSACFYNTQEEIDRLVEGIKLVQEMFG